MVDVHLFKMNLKFQIIDTTTGEILAHRYANYACNFDDKNDVGFRKILAWAQSCVRGIRCNNVDSLELRIGFCAEKAPQYLDLQVDGIKVF